MPRLSPGFHLVDAGRRCDAGEIEAIVASWSSALRQAGLEPREPVALLTRNSGPAAMAILAVRRAGGVPAPLHPALAQPEVDELIRRAGARLALVEPGLPPPTRSRAVRLPSADSSLAVPPLPGQPRALEGDYLLFTSGTEGRPKGVFLSEAGQRAHAAAVAERLPTSPQDRWLATLSFSHVGGVALLLRAAELGWGVVFPPASPVAELSPLVAQERITHVPLVPTAFQRWLEAHGEAAPPPSLRCVLVGGAAARPETVERARLQGWPVRPTYGLTEAGSQVATAREDSPPGSVGPPLAGVEVRIQGDPREAGSSGQILVRSPASCVGHLDTRPAIDADGWLHTEDVGRLDGAGNLWIVGRRSDLIVTGGENVDPMEVETAVASHPSVADAAVVGLPDREWGESVVAFVVLRPGQRLGLEDLREHCGARLARFKLPKRIEVLDRIPRTPTGKVRRAELRSASRPAPA